MPYLGGTNVVLMVSYVATTEKITVTVHPVYLDSKTDFFARRFVFGYLVRIENGSDVPVRLLRRHWRIQEEGGRVQHVDGVGVIGRRPRIKPGEEYAYSSYSVLATFVGTMEGHYTMEHEDGKQFRVDIPRFDLRAMAN